MTNYKRFISYLYSYELGNKKGNVGFARVETSDEVCKVTVHCALKVIPKKDCRVYLLRRQTSLVLSKEVGTAQLKDGLLDVKLSYENGTIDQEGFHFKDCIGILLMYSKDNYIGAKWDGSNITYHEASLIEQNINQVMKVEPSVKDSFIEQPQNESIKPFDSTKLVESTKIGSTIQIVPASEVVVIEQGLNQTKMPTMVPEEVLAEGVKAKIEEDTKIKEAIQQLDIKIVDTKMEDIKSVEIVKQKSMVEKEALERKASLESKGMNQQESEEGDLLQSEIESTEAEDVVSVASSNMDATNPWVDHPAARAILSRFVRMYPFDDGEMAECVRLEPKDIGLFPMSAWVLGNNSFVLHSYSSFRHLLFSKKLTREGCEYYLMVPGFYSNREKQLAQMFGFEMFKGSRRRGPKGGEFGYWYVKILFE